MQAVILAGGEGIKLRPLTFTVPKPLLPIINKPIIDYILFILKAAGVTNVILTTDYLADQIEDYLTSNDFGLTIILHRIDTYNGSARILHDLSDQLEAKFVVVLADCLFDFPLGQAIRYFQHEDVSAGLLVRREEDILGKGGFVVREGKITEIVKKGDHSDQPVLSDAWIYYFKKEVLALIDSSRFFDIHLDLIQACFDKKKPMAVVEMNQFWGVIGRVHPYIAANFWLLQNIGTPTYIGANTTIHPSAKLIAPYFIDEDCVIGENAEIGPNSIINKGVQIGPNTKVDTTIIHPGSKIGANGILSNCIVADNCELDDHVKVGLMAIIASSCKLGARCVINDGARVGPHVTLPPETTVRDVVFPVSMTSSAGKRTEAANHLQANELKFCLTLQEAGEQTFDGLLSLTGHSKEALQPLIDTLIQKQVILSYGENPVIYSLYKEI